VTGVSEPGTLGTPTRAGRWLLPAVTLPIAAAPYLCVPAIALLAQMDANCGTGFDHPCFDGRHWAFTYGPMIAACISILSWILLWVTPPRYPAIRIFLAGLVVLPSVVLVCGAVIGASSGR
jgi:hypothetical protein